MSRVGWVSGELRYHVLSGMGAEGVPGELRYHVQSWVDSKDHCVVCACGVWQQQQQQRKRGRKERVVLWKEAVHGGRRFYTSEIYKPTHLRGDLDEF